MPQQRDIQADAPRSLRQLIRAKLFYFQLLSWSGRIVLFVIRITCIQNRREQRNVWDEE